MTVPGSITSRESYSRQNLFFYFVIAIFLGNVHFHVTLPIALLLLPFMLSRRYVLPERWYCYLPIFLGALTLVQWKSGYPLRQADYSIYLTLLYSSVVFLVMSQQRRDDRLLSLGIILGSLAVALWMLGAMILGHVESNDFYDVKNSARTPLGSSNYLAVFIMFGVMQSLYKGKLLLALFFSVVVALTFSRTGYFMLAAGGVAWWVDTRTCLWSKKKGLCITLAFSLPAITFLGLWHYPSHLPESLAVRVSLWQAAVDRVIQAPWLGTPRSYYLGIFKGYAWDPHNSILNLALLFGCSGVVFYAFYIYKSIQIFASLAASQSEWRGIITAFALTLVWSLFEVILLTPAYDILLATLLGLAVAKTQDRVNSERSLGTNRPLA